MISKKKLDDIDLVVINQPWSEEERKEFSAFLKARKLKTTSKSKVKQSDVDKLAKEVKKGQWAKNRGRLMSK